MGLVKLYIQKDLAFVETMSSAYVELTHLSGQHERLEKFLPVATGSLNVQPIQLAAGEWLVEARFPSGETLCTRIAIPEESDPAQLLDFPLTAQSIPQETRGWSSNFSSQAFNISSMFGVSECRAVQEQGFNQSQHQSPLQLNVFDRNNRTLAKVRPWSEVNGEEIDDGVLIRAGDLLIDPWKRYFISLRNDNDRLSLPLPWPGTTTIQVRALLDKRNLNKLTLRAWVMDPSVAPVMSYLDASDFRPARVQMDETGAWAEKMLLSKYQNPMRAAIGALALIRLREFGRLHDWVYNLARDFAWLSDGAVIAAWCTLMVPSDESQSISERCRQAVEHVTNAAKNGAPYFADSVRLLREVCQMLTNTKGAPTLPASYRRWSERLSRAISPDSFIAVYEPDARESFTQLIAGAKEPTQRRNDMSNDASLEEFVVSDEMKQQFAPILTAIKEHRRQLTNFPEAVYVRPGFQMSTDTTQPVVVIGVMPPLSTVAETLAGNLSRELNVPVILEEAAPQEQIDYLATRLATTRSNLAFLLEPTPLDFRPPIRGRYKPPAGEGAPQLKAVTAKMKLTIATSPDAGWPVLKQFLEQPVLKSMNIGIYQFTAEHVYKAIRHSLLADDDATLTMVLHPRPEAIPETGTKSKDVFGPTLLDRLKRALGGRFQHALTTLGKEGEFASAYHIKVIVADKKRFWLSSGNLQSSNQPHFDPFSDDELPTSFHRKYNREHHVIIENSELAKTFAGFLEYDFARATDQPFDFGPPTSLPDLIVSQEPEFDDFAAPRFFPPLHLEEKVYVQPILSPDNYVPQVTKLIEKADTRLWIQNQYINLNPTEDFKEFKKIVNLIKKKIDEDIDVRIICRDLMGQEKLDMLLTLGFPRKVFRFMEATHTKVIIVDDERVLIGSHNLSNEGVVSNRDASLIIEHPTVVAHCAEIFEYDWEHRATSKPKKKRPRVARNGEQPSFGSVRVQWSELYDEPPRPIPSPIIPKSATPDSEPSVAFGLPGDEDIHVNGIDAVTGKPLVAPIKVTELAKKLRQQAETVPPELRSKINATHFHPFGLPDSVDPDDIGKAGWGVVIPEGKPELFDKIKTLWEHRKQTVPANLLKKLIYKSGETVRNWLRRNGVTFGSQLPTAVPFHLLLVASPEDISFEFQYLLDLEYAVGRLWFDKEEDWQKYCEAVVKTETAGSDRSKKIVWLAPRHDPATRLSHDELIKPLIAVDPSGLTSLSGYESIPLMDKDAKREKLQITLRDAKPAFLFTASHGIGLGKDEAEQRSRQGALLTADWNGTAVGPDDCFAAAHVDSEVRGMIAFLFACFSAGTPVRDNYPMDLANPPDQIANVPFVAALPQRLLAQGALAVIGHVDRAWGCSIRPAGLQNQLGPFRNMLDRVLRGRCVGNATRDFTDRSAVLSDELLSVVAPGGVAVNDEVLVWTWVERNDAKSYILLGDPAVRLPKVT